MATFRIAVFNVENLFDRPKAMNGSTLQSGSAILAAHATLNTLLQQVSYSADAKAEISKQLDILGLLKSDEARFALLRQIRGKLLKRSGGVTTVVADGRNRWIGWVELTRERIDELPLTHTAQVITDVDADIFGVVEAENRVALKHFSDAGLTGADRKPLYPHVMVVDGNDDRGIDVGVMTRAGFPIETIRSHVDDLDEKGRVFSRDCPEYAVRLPNGNRLIVLVNHFKSKGYGVQAKNDANRRRQAARVADIYRHLVTAGEDRIAVIGDLNDTPGSAPLEPLLAQTDLADISRHPRFVSDGRDGTYANGTKGQKIDYLLLSPRLFDSVTGGAVFRMGVWGGRNGTLFPHYPTMTSPAEAASDHAAIYADIELD